MAHAQRHYFEHLRLEAKLCRAPICLQQQRLGVSAMRLDRRKCFQPVGMADFN